MAGFLAIEQALNFDLVCIAGDLLDMFKSETRIEQSGDRDGSSLSLFGAREIRLA
jgi:hypothetical protein